MLNLLSFVGMSLQSELCLWTLLGLLRTIFDATLFKVNANLKQVWQMTMPPELSLPVQRALRTMISGVMLVQCFTVYVYLASYIVLLYPIFLEERPTLVLPWLLLAAIRKFLCSLTSLSLGLGVCVLLGPRRSSCIRFVVIKVASIIPAVYMWLLVLSYYNALKVAESFKRFPVVLPPGDIDYGLELAVRRRRTKSLMDETLLRKKIVASFSYGDEITPTTRNVQFQEIEETQEPDDTEQPKSDAADVRKTDVTKPDFYNLSFLDRTMLTETYEDWFGSELVIPRDTDRIMEQFVIMLLRISAYLSKKETEPLTLTSPYQGQPDPPMIVGDDADTPPSVGNNKTLTSSYLQRYPQIFMKKEGSRGNGGLNWEEGRVSVVENISNTNATQQADFADLRRQFEPNVTTLVEASEKSLKDSELSTNVMSEVDADKSETTIAISSRETNPHWNTNQTDEVESLDSFKEILTLLTNDVVSSREQMGAVKKSRSLSSSQTTLTDISLKGSNLSLKRRETQNDKSTNN